MLRGDVFEIELPRGRGHVQHGRRYAVVVQSPDLGALSTTVICPTSRSAGSASFHPEVTISGAATFVMCEMVSAIDVRTLTRHAGRLTLDEIREVDAALELVLDLGR